MTQFRLTLDESVYCVASARALTHTLSENRTYRRIARRASATCVRDNCQMNEGETKCRR